MQEKWHEALRMRQGRTNDRLLCIDVRLETQADVRCRFKALANWTVGIPMCGEQQLKARRMDGIAGSCLLSSHIANTLVPGAESCVGPLAKAPAGTPEAAYKCMLPRSMLDVNSSTLQALGVKRKLTCTNLSNSSTGIGSEGMQHRRHLKQPSRRSELGGSPARERRAVDSLLARGGGVVGSEIVTLTCLVCGRCRMCTA